MVQKVDPLTKRTFEATIRRCNRCFVLTVAFVKLKFEDKILQESVLHATRQGVDSSVVLCFTLRHTFGICQGGITKNRGGSFKNITLWKKFQHPAYFPPSNFVKDVFQKEEAFFFENILFSTFVNFLTVQNLLIFFSRNPEFWWKRHF